MNERKRKSALRLGLVIALVLVVASAFGASANATQPECMAINQAPSSELRVIPDACVADGP
jgi:hypothetical protein